MLFFLIAIFLIRLLLHKLQHQLSDKVYRPILNIHIGGLSFAKLIELLVFILRNVLPDVGLLGSHRVFLCAH